VDVVSTCVHVLLVPDTDHVVASGRGQHLCPRAARIRHWPRGHKWTWSTAVSTCCSYQTLTTWSQVDVVSSCVHVLLVPDTDHAAS